MFAYTFLIYTLLLTSHFLFTHVFRPIREEKNENRCCMFLRFSISFTFFLNTTSKNSTQCRKKIAKIMKKQPNTFLDKQEIVGETAG
jgi:hypothetical protein